jgi:hypothetical protein
VELLLDLGLRAQIPRPSLFRKASAPTAKREQPKPKEDAAFDPMGEPAKYSSAFLFFGGRLD